LKTQKLILEPEYNDHINIGLIRLLENIPRHEFFYKLNIKNHSHFTRIDDFKIEKNYFDYFHTRFETYSQHLKSYLHIIENKSITSIEKQKSLELFSDEGIDNYLIPENPDINYIIKSEELFDDFSLILLPEEISQPLEIINLEPDSELHTLFQYYE